MPRPSPEHMPGFRRRFKITPSQRWVCAELEDDYHCMSVTVHHDGVMALAVEPGMERAPWTTCSGAEEECGQTFTGVALTRFSSRKTKFANCTHLYDLALLCARHAFDEAALVYDLSVSDPVDGKRKAEIRRNAKTVFRWDEVDGEFTEPEVLAGMTFESMQPWVTSLDLPLQEAVRMLRWGSMIARGRIIPIEEQSDATKMPATCYTFQPLRAGRAERIGKIIDFSGGLKQPLEDCGAKSPESQVTRKPVS